MTTQYITVSVPVNFRRKGCRKLILLPNTISAQNPVTAAPDTTLLNAIAKAHRWQMLYERGSFASLDAFAEKYGINVSYAARILRLNLLAPDIREAILHGHQPRTLKLADLLAPFPALWTEQREKFSFPPDSLAKPTVHNQ
jgi:hypothetical protein